MFFTQHQQQLAQRCEALQSRGAALRLQLAASSRVVQTPLALADQGLAGLHWLRDHPHWVAVGVAFLVAARPRRALRWGWRTGSRAWAGWRLWRRWQRWQAAAGPLLPTALRSTPRR